MPGDQAAPSANVAARLPGSDAGMTEEHLVMTAHLDHLGVGTFLEGDSIFNGTLDNASGSAALLTLERDDDFTDGNAQAAHIGAVQHTGITQHPHPVIKADAHRVSSRQWQWQA